MSAATLERQPFLGGIKHNPSARKYTPWRPAKTDNLASIQHVMLNELTYRDRAGHTYRFWSLAPIQPGRRRGEQVKTHEFVWLIPDSEPDTVCHALAHRDTGEITWLR